MNLAAGAWVTPTTTMIGWLGLLLSLPAWFFFLRGAWHLLRYVRRGQPTSGRTNRPWARALTTLRQVVLHSSFKGKPLVAAAHWMVMVGFLLGTAVWFEAYIQTFNPRGGWPWVSEWPLYHLVDELLGIATVAGVCYLIGVRLRVGKENRVDRFYGSNARAAHFVEAVVLLEGLGMLLVKAGKIATFGDIHPHWWSDSLTMNLARILPASAVMVSLFALFKLLTGMVWLFVVGRQLRWGVAWHRILAFFNLFFQRNPSGEPPLGALPPLESKGKALTIDTADPDEDTLGVGTVGDASWKMLLDVATCTECGRCQEQCPAWHTDKPLSPKLLVTGIRDAALESHSDMDVLKLVGESQAVDPDALWSCTNCGACVEQCPVDIEHIDHVANLRRFQVLAESEFPSELTGLFRNLESAGNPWGRAPKERASWIAEARRDGIEVPVFGEDVKDFSDLEYLFWVGCAGAYDDEGRKTTRAIVDLLHVAGVKFAVLSKGETCTGDPARRAGNEFLFQMLAQDNIDTLNGVFEGVPGGQRKIITSCPHCFNTLRNEYGDFGGHYDVFHHTQLLNRLVRDGRLKPVPRPADARKPVTYHDPCFLGRHNKVYDPPRELVAATGANLLEMDRSRETAFCCGAGGARMFMEEKLGTRINENRSAEAIATGAEEIVVGCPFCNSMLTSGVKAATTAPAPAPTVRDVARVLRDAISTDGELPPARERSFLDELTRLPLGAGRDAGAASGGAAVLGGATVPGGAPAPGGAPMPSGVPAPGGAPAPVDAPASSGTPDEKYVAKTGGAPTPGDASAPDTVPTRGGAAAPGMPGGAPSPRSAPAPGGVPAPGSVPAPGGAPTPSAVPAPGGAAAPHSNTAANNVPAPGNATPQATSGRDSTPPKAPRPGAPAPGSAVPPAPTNPAHKATGPAVPPPPGANPPGANPAGTNKPPHTSDQAPAE